MSIPAKTPLFLLHLLAALLLVSCTDEAVQTNRLDGFTMGTSYSITVTGTPRVSPEEIDRTLQAIENSMSTYRENSELMQLNRAPLNTWVELSPALFSVLARSMEIYQLSGGAFDPSVGPLVNLWGFGPAERQANTIPDDDAIQSLLENVGLHFLELDAARQSVRKQRAIELDLSGIAKGYAVDAIATLLAANGTTDFLVEIGGEIRSSGHNAADEAWRIAIEKPDPDLLPATPQRIIAVSNTGMATSGNYRNFFTVDGQIYAHTIDPRSGYPVTHNLRSVTVLADDAATADALATAFSVIGPAAALALANRENIPIHILSGTQKELSETMSEAFSRMYND